MKMAIKRLVKWVSIAVFLAAAGFLGLQSYRALSGPPLQAWHTFVPVELRASELDAADWSAYLAREASIFDSVRAEVSQKLPPDARVPINRYFEQSPIYPARFVHDWNRSYVVFRTKGRSAVSNHGRTTFRNPAYPLTISLARRCTSARLRTITQPTSHGGIPIGPDAAKVTTRSSSAGSISWSVNRRTLRRA